MLGVAWEQRDSVSPDEANLLSNLRRHLRVNQFEHRVLEAKLRRFPSVPRAFGGWRPKRRGNELHTRAEITAARRALHNAGLLFCIRQDGVDYDVIPDELAAELRAALGIELRTDAYRELFKFHKVRTKAHLTEVLERHGTAFARSDKVDQLVEPVILNVPPSKAIASASPASDSRETSSATGAATSTSPRPAPSTPEAWGCRAAARIAEASVAEPGAAVRLGGWRRCTGA